MRILLLIAVGLWIAPFAPSFGAGLARSSNFVVGAEQQELADAVLAQAEAFRQQIAQEWLGDDLPPDGQRVVIHVFVSDEEDHALTRIDPGDARGRHHMMWIVTAPHLINSALAHEMTHVVFGCQYQNRVPIWANEGAASLLDDPRRQATRQRIIGEFARTGQWPDLNDVFDRASLAVSDAAGYATAASVTEFLLARAGKPTFLRFALEGQALGWDAALWKYYQIRNVGGLQSQWQDWSKQQRTHSSSSPLPSKSYLDDL
jgi:hypothetical protein